MNFDFEWLRRPMRQSSRRAWILAIYAAVTLATVLGVARAPFPITFLLGSLAMLATARLNYATSRSTSLPDVALDERQQGLKNQAHQTAYHISYGVFCLTAVILAQLGVQSLIVIGILAYAYFVLASILPTTVLAWLEPDPPEDEATPGLKQAF